MLSVKFTWLEAAVATTLVLAVAAAAALARRRSGSPRLGGVAVFARETGMLLGLFALWTYAGSKSEVSLADALRRAAWIWQVEQGTGLPSEQALQRLFLPHPLLVQAFNWYYAVLHFPVLIGCLVWLFVRHRGEYWRVRTMVLLFTGISLLVQFIPVAPPRLLPLTKMTDTGLAYGQSVYGTHAGIDADQLSAMPSIHVGWALLVALVVVAIARSRWRWLALAYPVLTTLAVVVTANHFWLDGIAAAALLAVSIGVQRAAGPAYRALAGIAPRSRPGPAAADVPEEVPAGAVPASAVPASAVPASAVPASAVPASAVPASAVPASAVSAGGASAGRAPAGAAPAGAAPAGVVLAAVSPNGPPEPERSPDAVQAAANGHGRGRRDPRPCAARAAVSAPARNGSGRKAQAGHAVPLRVQDGR
jgi:hypothetical protein